MTETLETSNLGEEPTLREINSKIDLLTEQIARLTEVLTVGLADFNARLDRTNTTIERITAVSERQALTIERQSLAIERLALILERQMETG